MQQVKVQVRSPKTMCLILVLKYSLLEHFVLRVSTSTEIYRARTDSSRTVVADLFSAVTLRFAVDHDLDE